MPMKMGMPTFVKLVPMVVTDYAKLKLLKILYLVNLIKSGQKKTFPAITAPTLKTRDLITELDEVAKVVVFNVPTISQEKLEDLVLNVVRSRIQETVFLDQKTPEVRQPKGLLRYWQELNRLLVEERGQFLCYNEPSDKLGEKNLRICLPLFVFWPVSKWYIITCWEDILEPRKRKLLLRGFIISLQWLIGFAL